MTKWLENDELFDEQLGVGHRWQRYVVGRLEEAGIECHHSPYVIDPSRYRDDPDKFADEVDIVVPSTGASSFRIEVKSRNLTFTGPTDFPYRTAIIYTVSGWNGKRRKPHAVVMVSQQTGGMAVAAASTRHLWTVEKGWDNVREINNTWYYVDRKHLRTFDHLVRAIKWWREAA